MIKRSGGVASDSSKYDSSRYDSSKYFSVNKRINSTGNSSGCCTHCNKKAQVTVFIIIGILILFTFAGIMYFTKTFTKQNLTVAEEPVMAESPQEFKPIQIYTESCLTQIGKKGLLILGEQGGYIHPELVGKYSAANPTDADGMDLDPVKVPYWHYNKNLNQAKTVSFASLQPKLYATEDAEMSIESQLSRYVEEKLDNCLNQYEPFSSQGFTIEITDKSAEKAQVNVGDSSVNFWLKMRVKAKKGEAEYEFEQFYVKIPLRLKHYYGVANGIAKAEAEHTFLENMAVELIQIYGQTDSEKLPPTSATTFEQVSSLTWSVPDVKEKFKTLLGSYIPMLRYLSSNNFYRYEYPVSDLSGLYQKTYDNLIIPLENAENTEIAFDYFGWEPYLSVNEGETKLSANNYVYKSPWPIVLFTFSFQQYQNTYDLSFPVLVTISDPAAFDGAGYKFDFALESNVVNNFAAIENSIEPELKSAGKETMICDENKKNTELVKTVVVDSFSKEPVESVQIGFSVPEQDTCVMGLTDDNGILETKYPAAYGGVVEFIKNDYLTNFYPVDTYNYKEQPGIIGYAIAGSPERVVELHKFKPINVSVKKKELNKCVVPLVCSYTYSGPVPGAYLGMSILPYKDISCKYEGKHCFFNQGNQLFISDSDQPIIALTAEGSMSKKHEYHFIDSVKDLLPEERTVITLTRVRDLNPALTSEDFATSFSLSGTESQEIELVPGIYQLTASVILNQEVTIPDDYRCRFYDIVSWETEECSKIKGTKIKQSVTGATELDTPATYLIITPEDLYNSKQLELYVLNYNIIGVEKTFTGTAKKCAGHSCLPGLGCLFEGCINENLPVNGLVLEDLSLIGNLSMISKMPEVSSALKPKFS